VFVPHATGSKNMSVKFWYQCTGCGTVFCKEMPRRELLLEAEAHDCWRARLERAGVTNRNVQMKFMEESAINPYIRHVAVQIRESDVPEKLREKILEKSG